MLKTIKIPTVAPICFGSRRNHHQGAISCLAKTTIMILLCSSLMTLWRRTSLLCKHAVHGRGRQFYFRHCCFRSNFISCFLFLSPLLLKFYLHLYFLFLNKMCYIFVYYYLLTHSLTHSLTPWSRVLLEKLTGSAARQEIPRLSGTRRFLTVPTSARHLSLS